ncbi:hypothetical protein MMC06_005638 [Schaereria dolodes]|nr:hypothetical protein [Schaereria dolodes]
MNSQAQYIKLAQSLPPKLLRFFARYPPPVLTTAHNPLGLNSKKDATSVTTPLITSSVNRFPDFEATNAVSLNADDEWSNPFRSTKHPITGNWHDPVYSLRRQADLVKLARANGVEELLPFTTKGTEERIRKREEQGLRVKGTGVGQKVKGKEWERTMKGRLDRRKQAMLEMPKLIQSWKQVISLITNTMFGIAKMVAAWSRSRLEELPQMICYELRWIA